MDPDVLKLAQLLAVVGAFGGAVAVVGALVHAIVARSKRPRVDAAARPAIDEARFTRLEQAVDAIAVEVERIGEAQRFSERLLGERAAERGAERAPALPPRRDEG